MTSGAGGRYKETCAPYGSLLLAEITLAFACLVRAIQMSTGVVEFQNKVEVPAAILISASKDVHTHTDVPKCAALAEYGITARCHMATDLRIYADDRAAVVVRANSG